MTCGRTLPCPPGRRSRPAAAIAVRSPRSRSPASSWQESRNRRPCLVPVVMVKPAATMSPSPARRSGTHAIPCRREEDDVDLEVAAFLVQLVLVGLEGFVDDASRLTALHEVAGLRVRNQHTDDPPLDHRVEVAGPRLALDTHRGDWIGRRFWRRRHLACGGLGRLALRAGRGREQRCDQRQGANALRR